MLNHTSVHNGLRSCIVLVASLVTVALMICACGEGSEEAEGGRVEAAPSRLSRTPSGENAVTLDAATRSLARLVIAPAVATTLHPEVEAYGLALDPSLLVTLQNELRTAEIALTNSAEQLTRTRTLFENDQNASRRDVEAKEAAFRSDEVRVQSATSRLRLEWGEAVAELDDVERADLIQRLIEHQSTLLRVDLPIGAADLSELPSAARVAIAGHEETILDAQVLSAAPVANATAPGQGFLLRTDASNALLRPGVPVIAYLPVPGEDQTGVTVPRGALVRHQGEVWVYVQLDGDQFVRRPIALAHPTDAGWFVNEGIKPGDRLVIDGAQVLLSEELRSQIHISD